MNGQQRRCIIVAGMHRSGTSALARFSNLLGADISLELMPAVKGNNDRGFWEPVEVVKIHDELLYELGSSWHDPLPLRDGWIGEEAAMRAKRRLAEELKRDFKSSDIFVVKDPRIPRILPLWLELLDELSIIPIVVIPVRNPLEVAGSLEKRDGFSITKSSLLYAQTYLDVELFSRGRLRCFASYERLLEDWRPLAKELSELAGMKHLTPQSVVQIDEYLTSELRHNRFSQAELLGCSHIAGLIVEMFDRMTDAAAGRSGKIPTAFDDFRNRFNEAHRLFDGFIRSEKQRADDEISRLNAALTTSEQRIGSEIGTLRSELEFSRLSSERLTSNNETLSNRIIDLDALLRVQSKDLSAAQLQIDALDKITKKLEELESAAKQRTTEDAVTAQRQLDAVARIASKLKESERTAERRKTEDLAVAQRQLDAVARIASKLEESERAAERRKTEDLAVAQGQISAIEGLTRKLEELERAAKRDKQELETTKRKSSWRRSAAVRRMALVFPRGLISRVKAKPPRQVLWSLVTLSFVPALRAWRRFARDRNLLLSSGFFDGAWYAERYGQFPAIEAAEHYLSKGSAEGRHPNALFYDGWYLERYPDVRKAGLNPAIHFLRYGAAEGRDPNPFFDSSWYLAANPDVRSAHVNPLVHYMRFGAAEHRDPSVRFSSRLYLELNADVADANVNPLAHYLLHGRKEGRRLFPNVDPAHVDEGDCAVGWVPLSPLSPFEAWLSRNRLEARAVQSIRERLDNSAGSLPRISIVMPVYNPPLKWLICAIESICKQIYPNWELCICDDCSSDPAISRALAECASADSRIKIVTHQSNMGIAAATNSAAELADGDFLAFVDHDDSIEEDALAEIALYAADHPQCDVIYSDDDKIDESGRRFDPQFKPDWSPTLLLSYMYLSHFLVVRRELFTRIAGIRTGFEGSQDFDFALRATEQARQVGHVARILYHWRAVAGSTAVTADAKTYSFDAGERAVRDAFARRSWNAKIVRPDWAKKSKLGIFSPIFPDTGPTVSILIPTRNRLDLLRNCVSSIRKTTYQNYKIVILDNESDEPETLNYLRSSNSQVIRIVCSNGVFSFAEINNAGVRSVDTDYVLLLNNDTEVIDPRWLSQMMGYAQMNGVGAVGAKLLFRNGTVQHNGIVHGYHDGAAGHAFKNASDATDGYLWYLKVARECSAVTAACMLTPRSLYLDMGGLDETNFAVAYNDVDYCYRLADRGLRSVMCPDATLYHDEGKSRGFADNPAELAALRDRYRTRTDPFYSPNLSRDNESFEICPYRDPGSSGAVRVAAVSHNLNHEGAPNSQFELITGLASKGIIDPVVLSPVDGPLRKEYERAGIEVQLVTPPRSDDVENFGISSRELARALRQSGVEVVYANTLQSFWAVSAAQVGGLPVLWNIRESEPWQTYFDFLPPSVRGRAYECFGYAYRVIFVAQATRGIWEPLNSHRNFSVIKNGLDLRRVASRGGEFDRLKARKALKVLDNEISIVLVGTVAERKGQLDLVQAISLLPADLASLIRVFIVGDRASAYSSAVHAEIQASPYRKRFTVVEEMGEPYVYFRAADVALCCSRGESYPRVVLEAMSFELPIITTPVFGIREQVQEGVNALFYDPGDVASLASHLELLATNTELRSKLASSSKAVLKSLPDYQDMLTSYSRLFREARLSSTNPAETTTGIKGPRCAA